MELYCLNYKSLYCDVIFAYGMIIIYISSNEISVVPLYEIFMLVTTLLISHTNLILPTEMLVL